MLHSPKTVSNLGVSKIHRAVPLHGSATILTDFLVIGLIRLLDHVTKVNHDLRPDLNQGPADVQSAALTTELCTLEICVQSNKQRFAQQ